MRKDAECVERRAAESTDGSSPTNPVLQLKVKCRASVSLLLSSKLFEASSYCSVCVNQEHTGELN